MSNTAFIVQKQDDLTSNDFLNFVVIDNGDGTRSLYFRDQNNSGLPGLASQITSSGFNSLAVPGGVTTPGLTVGRIPKATASQVLGDSIISEAAGVITIAGSLLLTTPLAVGQGGTGATTFTANGVLYGNGTGAIQVTAQGAANSVLAANAGAPSFSTSPTLTNLTLTGVLAAAAGTITAPAIYLDGDTASGIWRPFPNVLRFTFSGVDALGLTTDTFQLPSTGSLRFSSGVVGAATDLFLSRAAPAKFRLGTADAAAPVAQTLSVQNVVGGTTDTAGANFTIACSQGTGAGAGGSFNVQVAAAGGSGSSQNALTTRLSLSSAGVLTLSALTAQAFIYSGASSALTATAAAAKGDMLLGTGSTLQILPVGANGTVLTADSAQATGVRWGTAPPTISGSPAVTNVAVFTSATDITGTALFVHTTTTGQTTLVSDAGSTFRSMKFQAGGASAPVGFEIANNTPNYVSRYALARGSAQFMTGSSAGDVCLTASGGSLRFGANASAGTDPAGTALAINATNCNFWDTAVTGGTFRVTSDSNTTLVTAASVGPWGHIIQAGTGATITFRLRNSTPANCADLGRCGSVNDFITGTAVGDIVLRAMGGALHMGVNATADTPPTAIGFTLDANGGGTFLGFVDDAGTSRVSTQFDKTSDTALANITGLTATLLAGISYSFEAYLMTTSNVAGGVQAAIAGTATATAIRYEGILVDANVNAGQARATALGGAVAAVTAVTAATITIKGTITVNAAGTLTVQFAQNASNGAASSVLVGSWFKVWRNN